MHLPNDPQVTLDPERALLHVADVAAAMTVAILRAFNDFDGIWGPQGPGTYRIHRIICRARDLRAAVADYCEYLDDPAEPDHDDFPF